MDDEWRLRETLCLVAAAVFVFAAVLAFQASGDEPRAFMRAGGVAFAGFAILSIGLSMPGRVRAAAYDPGDDEVHVGFGTTGEDDWVISPAALQRITESRPWVMLEDNEDNDPKERFPEAAAWSLVDGARIVWMTDSDGSEVMAVVDPARAGDPVLLERIVRDIPEEATAGLRVVID